MARADRTIGRKRARELKVWEGREEKGMIMTKAGIARRKRVVVAVAVAAVVAMQQVGEVAEDREERMRAALATGPPVGTAMKKSTAQPIPYRGKERERIEGAEKEEPELIRTIKDRIKEKREAVVAGLQGQEKMGLQVTRKTAQRVDREWEGGPMNVKMINR